MAVAANEDDKQLFGFYYYANSSSSFTMGSRSHVTPCLSPSLLLAGAGPVVGVLVDGEVYSLGTARCSE